MGVGVSAPRKPKLHRQNWASLGRWLPNFAICCYSIGVGPATRGYHYPGFHAPGPIGGRHLCLVKRGGWRHVRRNSAAEEENSKESALFHSRLARRPQSWTATRLKQPLRRRRRPRLTLPFPLPRPDLRWPLLLPSRLLQPEDPVRTEECGWPLPTTSGQSYGEYCCWLRSC